MNTIERRFLDLESFEVRIEERSGKKYLTGYPIVYGKMSVNLGGFREVVAAGAFDESIKNDDIRGLRDHTPTLILGRTKAGTMSLLSDGRGVKMDVELPDTGAARDLVVSVERGDITGGSFGFSVLPGGAEWTDTEDTLLRTVMKGKLYDVGPVTFPAYPDTEMWTRAMNLEEARSEMERFKAEREATWKRSLKRRERELALRA